MTQDMRKTMKMKQNILKHLLLMAVMMTVGATEAWGQTDYSGTWYIASGGKSSGNGSTYTYNSSTPSNNFYLCPTEGWCYYKPTDDFSNDGTTYPNPFLTTYKCRDGVYDASKAVWIIEKAPNSDYYYIIHKKTGKYLISNGQIRTTTNPDRIRVHLESIADPTAQGDKVLFDISIPSGKTHLVISPKGITDGTDLNHDNADHTTHRWLSVNFGNYNNIIGNSGKKGGPTGYENVAGIVCIYTSSDVNAPFYLENAKCATPTISFNNSNKEVTIVGSTEGATIYYTTDLSTPDPTNSGGENPTQVYDPTNKPNFSETTTIKAIATKNQMVDSEVATITIAVNPTINLSIPTGGYTYGGTALEPEVSVVCNGTTLDPSEYEVSYSDNTNVGTATVSITNADGGDYIVYGTETFTIAKAALTVTAMNHSITYGDAPANNGVTYTGFVNEETASVLGGTLGYDYSYTQYADVGTYHITPSGLTSDNYNISFVDGTLTVAQKGVALTWVGESSYTYDGAVHDPTATITSISDIVNDDDVTGVTVTLTANTGSSLTDGHAVNTGSYQATASLSGTKTGNYRPDPSVKPFTIAPKIIGDGTEVAEGFSVVLVPSGNDITVTVTDGGTTLDQGTHYTVEKETQGSDTYVTVSGIGNYGGSYQGLYANPVFFKPTGANEYATVYRATSDMVAPIGITPYIVMKVNPSIGTINIAPVDYIPEGVPVLMLADTDIQGFLASSKPDDVTEITAQTKNSNVLKVAPEGGVAVEAAQVYMFYRGEFVLTKAGTLTEGKFYLNNPNYKTTPTPGNEEGGNGSRSVLRFVVEESTGIAEMGNEKEETRNGSAWHSLDGRRLSGKPAKQGLYIWNGRKTVIKK